MTMTRRAMEDPVGDLVAANPWTAVGIAVGAGAAIAAGVAWLVVGRSTSAPAATTPTTTSDGSTRDGSSRPTTTTSTTTTSTPTSTTSSSSSSSSTPSYDASSAVTLYIQNAGKKVAVGTSLIVLDASTGQTVTTAQVSGQAGVVAAGSTPGTFLAVAPGTVKIYDPASGQGTVLVVAAATGTSGVPKVAGLLLPRALRAA